jgi:hypothetical protein
MPHQAKKKNSQLIYYQYNPTEPNPLPSRCRPAIRTSRSLSLPILPLSEPSTSPQTHNHESKPIPPLQHPRRYNKTTNYKIDMNNKYSVVKRTINTKLIKGRTKNKEE